MMVEQHTPAGSDRTSSTKDKTSSNNGESRRMKMLRRAGLFSEMDPNLEISRATKMSDLSKAYSLVHDVFLERGYIRQFPGGLRMRAFEALPTTATFVAKANDSVVGVQSIVADTDGMGLPSDRSFKPELQALRDRGRFPCEAANESIALEHRRGAVPTELMRCCFAHALAIKCTDLITAISAGHARFYELLGFEVFTPIRSFSEQLNDPVLLVRIDITALGERFADVNVDDGNDEAFVKNYYIDGNPYHQHVHVWAADAGTFFNDPVQLREFFRDKSDLLNRCNPREIQAIEQAWGKQLLDEVMQSETSRPAAAPMRWRETPVPGDKTVSNTP